MRILLGVMATAAVLMAEWLYVPAQASDHSAEDLALVKSRNPCHRDGWRVMRTR